MHLSSSGNTHITYHPLHLSTYQSQTFLLILVSSLYFMYIFQLVSLRLTDYILEFFQPCNISKGTHFDLCNNQNLKGEVESSARIKIIIDSLKNRYIFGECLR